MNDIFINDKMLCANRIKLGLKKRNMKQTDLCSATGIPKSAMSQYLNGSFKPKQDRVYLIAKALETSEAWIMGYDVPFDKQDTDNSKISLKSNNSSVLSISNIIPLPKTKKLPLLGTIACGEPILADENIEEYIETPDNIRATFCLRCKGDSMINARIYDGDIVYIREQPDVENGEIGAVIINDEATLKRIYKYKNKIVLQPENTAYEPLVYVNEELDTIRILGKAVAFTSTVR